MSKAWNGCAVVLLVGMLTVNLAFLWYGRNFILQGYGDFASFYTAAKLIRAGQGSKIYDERSQWAVQQEFSAHVQVRHHALPYIRPPFEALLLVPLSYLPYPAACVVWMAVNILALLLIPFLLKPYLDDPISLRPALLGALCLSTAPVVFNLLQGQDGILLLLVFVLVFIALKEGAETKAGIYLAVGLFKFHLTIPLVLVLVFRRKPAKMMVGFLAAAAGLLFISATTVGWNCISTYPRYLWVMSQDSRLGVIPPEIMPNLRGFIAMLTYHKTPHHFASVVGIPITLLGILLAANGWPRSSDSDEHIFSAGFSLSIVILILTSFYFSGYDLVLLILPLFLIGGRFLRTATQDRLLRNIFFACISALLFIPAYWTMISPIRRQYWMPIILLILAITIFQTIKAWKACLSSSIRSG